VIYISGVPPDLQEVEIVKCLRECLPFKIQLNHPVPNRDRHKPDAYYDWMTRQVLLIAQAEKALAILPFHFAFVMKNMTVSPAPPPSYLPFPDPTTRIRYIRPQRLVFPPEPSPSRDGILPTAWPTSGDIFEALRPWGSLRQVNVWRDEDGAELEGEEHNWRALAEFWHEDEAERFSTGFGATASYLKGWQIFVIAGAQSEPISQPSFVPSIPTPQPPHPSAITLPSHNVQYLPQTPAQLSSEAFKQSVGIMSIRDSPEHGVVPVIPGMGVPPTPPYTEVVPWSAHNVFAGKNDYDVSLPFSPTADSHRGSQLSTKGSIGSLNSLSRSVSGTPRKWSLDVSETVSGEYKAVGLIANDGMYIQHGPGQHIRPAPVSGPGSTSASGLVDYANVFVKSLDPDINSDFLKHLFEPMGRIVSAKVMRDDLGRSRGYGFVSFQSPEMAAAAIAQFNGTTVGRQQIQVTLHEPRKLRPEKIAERKALGLPASFGRASGQRARSSTSPQRTDAKWRSRNYSSISPFATTDDIRLLSPQSRKVELEKRVDPRVRTFAQLNAVPEGFIQPAVSALVQSDLELISLLHDPHQLQIRIAETIGTLQGDPDLDSVSSLPLSSRESDTLHAEVARIDPMEVDQVMTILLSTVTIEELRHCLSSKSYLAATYNVAKKELIRRQEVTAPTVPAPTPVNQSPSPPRSSLEPNQDPPTILDIPSATLPALAALSARDIVANLTYEGSDILLFKLNLGRPAAQEVSGLAAWSDKVMKKPMIERKTEMAAMLAKRLDGGLVKRSQKMKVAMGIVNGETDDGALCRL
ncbi:hypothetical protein TREMEDRAFT_30506, partial [Tremella mesenterica DSM 1558]|uniref:uncharacterized protein n=1 Tax=Tremella mesenterica (strain ATCC 24925 / CBS 8224 / DSM 1558 / NBRC 9311 / NRRL Y-6157 / RJB 2259-6 / UBC 559-6) TaxID=578456 RepID=UPI0003F491EE